MIFTPKILEQHIAILGKTGSGKTFTAKGIVESLLRKRERVCIIDPVSAWWGLRSDVSGKGEGFPIVIFGGAHGDIEIGASHGAAVAEIVATSNNATIIDLKQMSVKARTTFFIDFTVTLMQKNQDILHMVIDEAHLFAPKGRVNSNQAGEMLSETNNMVTGGRGIGLRFVLITQRPAKLHNDCLGSVETLVAMRLTLPADRDAVQLWVDDCADPKQGVAVLASLPKLETGEGWVWSPTSDILKRTKFPAISTFDSSNPKNLHRSNIRLSGINLPEIRARLDKAATDVINDDPVQLKRLLVKATAELRQRAAVPAPAQVAKVDPMEHPSVVREITRLKRELQSETEKLRDIMKRFFVKMSGYFEDGKAILERYRVHTQDEDSGVTSTTQSAQPPVEPRTIPKTSPVARAAQSTRSNSNGRASAQHAKDSPPAEGLTGPEQRILNAIAWLESLGVNEPQQVAVAFLAGYTYGGGAFNNPRGALRTKGLVEYGAGETIRLTDAGRSVASFPEGALTNDELHHRVMERLPGPESKILRVLLEKYPDSISNDDLATAAGYTPNGGAYNNPRGRLRSLGLIDYRGGMVVAKDLLFPEA